MKALVTGIGGFAGSHLVEHLLAHTDLDVYGITHSEHASRGLQAVLMHPQASRVMLYRGTMTDAAFVCETLAAIQPDYVFHLAAQASVRDSWDDPQHTYTVNIFSQLNLMEALRQNDLRPRVLIAGTADVYGFIQPEELPVDEQTPLRPANPYAVSKVTQDMMGYQYWVAHRLPVVRVRPFNHTGPRQSDAYVISSFARQIAEIERGLRPPVVQVGNLEAQRDFSDVRDIVRAYWLAVTKGEPGQVYNLGSGTARSVRDVLDALLNMSKVPIKVETDPDRMRPVDMPELRCNTQRFSSITGWQPVISFEQTLRDILEDWRTVIRIESEE